MPFNVTMPNGRTISDVPDGTTSEQLEAKIRASGQAGEFGLQEAQEEARPKLRTEAQGRGIGLPKLPSIEERIAATGGPGFRREELGFFEKTGNLISDFTKAVKVHGESIPQSAFRLLRPKKVLNLKGDGFVDRDTPEGKKVVEIEREAYARAIHAPGEEETVSQLAKVASVLADPTLIAAGTIVMPARTAKLVNATRGQKAAAQLSRMAKIFAGGAGIVGTIEGLDELAKKGEIESPEQLATMMVLGGTGGVVLDRAIAGLGAVFNRSLSPKGANKLITKIDDKAATFREQGLSPAESAQRAFREVGIVDAQQVRLLEDLAKRRIDFAKSFNDVIPSISSKISKNLGLNKVTFPEKFGKFFTPISTKIRNISPRIMAGLRNFELRSHQAAQRAKEEVLPFLKNFQTSLLKQGLTKAEREQLKGALLNGDISAIRQVSINKGGTAISDSYLTARKTLDRLFDEAKAQGIDVGFLPNFFPRLIRDMDGLLDVMGKQQGSRAQEALKQALITKQNRAINKALQQGQTLTDEQTRLVTLSDIERADVMNKFLRGFAPKIGSKPGALKQRKIDEIPEEWLKFYADPDESLINYINTVAHSIEKHKFFGMNGALANKQLVGDDAVSIGKLLSDELGAGRITFREADKLQDLLQSRFIGGERAPGKLVQGAKNIFYSVVLGQPTSSLTQIGDLGLSSFANGLLNTIKSVFGRRLTTTSELGIANKIAEEFSSTVGTAKFLNKVLTGVGFKAVDRLGKTAAINGAIRKSMKQVAIDKNGKIVNQRQFRKFLQEWQPIFENQTDDLINSLRTGNIDQNVKLLAWNKLSDLQPITLSEMPQKYLDVTNGRVWYMLRSFTLKQIDILRRDAISKIAKGNVAEGTTDLMRFAMMFTAANIGAAELKNLVKGRDVDIKDTVIDNLYKNFGMSEYIVNLTGRKGVQAALINLFAPPILTKPAGDLDEIIRNSESLGKAANSVSDDLPIIGQLYHNWFGGGIENFEDRQRRQKEKERFNR